MFNRKKISTKTLINLETIPNFREKSRKSLKELTEEEEETTKTQKRSYKPNERSAESSSVRSTTFLKLDKEARIRMKYDIFNPNNYRDIIPGSARYKQLLISTKERSFPAENLSKQKSKETLRLDKTKLNSKFEPNNGENKEEMKGKVQYLLSYGKGNSESLKLNKKAYLQSPKFKNKKNLKKILTTKKSETQKSLNFGGKLIRVKKKIQNKYLSLRDETVTSPKLRTVDCERFDQRMNSGKKGGKSGSVQRKTRYNQRSKEVSKLDLLFKYPEIEARMKPRLNKSKNTIIKMRVDGNKRVIDMLNRRSGRPPNRPNFCFRATAKRSCDIYQSNRTKRVSRDRRRREKSKTKNDFLKREVLIGLYKNTARNLPVTFKSLQRNIKKHQSRSKRIFEKNQETNYKGSLSRERNNKRSRRKRGKKKSCHKIKLDNNIEYEYKVYNPLTPRDSFDSKENRYEQRTSKIPLSLLKGKLAKKGSPVVKASKGGKDLSKLKLERKLSMAKRKKSFTVFDDINIDPSGFGAWKTGPDTLPEYLINHF